MIRKNPSNYYGEYSRAVEVESRVKREAILQLQRLVERFREFFPEHRGKAAMGILAGVDWDRGIPEKAREAGFLRRIQPNLIYWAPVSDFARPALWIPVFAIS
uniref:Uncharacterized protein n=1 Tax=Candidatus Kentrum sp. TC TaxID=2126339 RepID=A0A450YP06_9GAMM|nr:MAG: hypothetical protein BECKTC1821E_GA0114239_102416 [Candidatus Kentron sp. TC]